MPEIVPFDFDDRVVRVHLDGNDTPWFVAKDVCGVLEIGNHRQATVKLDDDEKGVIITDTLGGRQEMAAVSESGLYGLIFTSRKPEAKRFRKWVTSEVLPALRRSGRYDVGAAQQYPALELPDVALSLKPQVRAQVLSCAVQAAKMDNAGSDAVMRHFELFCRVISERPARPTLPMHSTLRTDLSTEQRVTQFLTQQCHTADAKTSVRASQLYGRFKEWHRTTHGYPIPRQKAFGLVAGQYFYKEKRSGHIRYFGIGLNEG